MHRTRTSAALTLTAICGVMPAAAPAFAAGPSTQDTSFLRAAHQGNLAEIAAGKDAANHATTDCVRQVAAKFVTDHTKLDSDVRALARKLNVSLPGGPSAEQRRSLAAVQGKAGTSGYDAAWLKLQSAAHTKTLAMIDREISGGSDSAAVAAAKAARPVVRMHLDMVSGGTCHKPGASTAVHAGVATGTAEGGSSMGVAALGAGGGLTAVAAAWYLRSRRRATTGR
jgi:putative membrane protein